MSACTGPLVSFFLSCLSMPCRRDGATWSDTLRMALHTFFLGCCFVIVVQQLSLTVEAYHQTRQEHVDAVRLYVSEQCATYRGASRPRIQECSELASVIAASPFVRAVLRVTRGWNSCLYMSCGELAVAVGQHLQYKIVMLLLALALMSQAMRLFACTKRRGQKYISARRLKDTRELLGKQPPFRGGYRMETLVSDDGEEDEDDEAEEEE